MLSPKKLVRMAVLGRRRLTLETKMSHQDSEQSTSCRAEKGHFVVYTIDRKRFMIPLEYLSTRIVMQLFHLSEEFGYTAGGRITLPCDGTFLEYAMSLINRGLSEEVERALLSSVFLPCHHACSAQSSFEAISQQVEVFGF